MSNPSNLHPSHVTYISHITSQFILYDSHTILSSYTTHFLSHSYDVISLYITSHHVTSTSHISHTCHVTSLLWHILHHFHVIPHRTDIMHTSSYHMLYHTSRSQGAFITMMEWVGVEEAGNYDAWCKEFSWSSCHICILKALWYCMTLYDILWQSWCMPCIIIIDMFTFSHIIYLHHLQVVAYVTYPTSNKIVLTSLYDIMSLSCCTTVYDVHATHMSRHTSLWYNTTFILGYVRHTCVILKSHISWHITQIMVYHAHITSYHSISHLDHGTPHLYKIHI